MKRLFCVVAVLAITGCKSLADVRNGQPDSTFISQKPVNDIAECILYGWQGKSYIDGPMKAYLQPLPAGKTVYTDSYIEVADITSSAQNNTEIKFYSQGRLHRNEMREVIKNCL